MRLPSNGGCDFTPQSELASADAVQWTARAMPSVVALTSVPKSFADPKFRLRLPTLNAAQTQGEPERVFQHGASTFRVHVGDTSVNPPAVLLPFDELFEMRATAALRLWRALRGRNPGPNPAALSPQRRNRLILALRTLDARLDKVSYRQIADALFHLGRMSTTEWVTHELRDRTIRLARLGRKLMTGGYRDLLLHPYRRRPWKRSTPGGDLTAL